jgi:hypothetical protein
MRQLLPPHPVSHDRAFNTHGAAVRQPLPPRQVSHDHAFNTQVLQCVSRCRHAELATARVQHPQCRSAPAAAAAAS